MPARQLFALALAVMTMSVAFKLQRGVEAAEDAQTAAATAAAPTAAPAAAPASLAAEVPQPSDTGSGTDLLDGRDLDITSPPLANHSTSNAAQEPGTGAGLITRRAVFLHPQEPLTAQLQASLQDAEAAFEDMQMWLQAFFNSNKSRLTSSRLQEARMAPNATGSLVPDQPAEGIEAAQPPPGPLDVPAAGVEGAQCDAQCFRRSAEQVLLHSGQPNNGASWVPLRWHPFPEDKQRWVPTNDTGGESTGTATSSSSSNSTSAICRLHQPGEPAPPRDYLLLVPVGDDLTLVNGWMSHPESATFDLVLLHYGNDANITCQHCTAVVHKAGAKWQLVWDLTRQPEWSQLSAGKRAVMVADDDLVMDTCTINRAFEVFDAYGLLLGQPSLCPTPHASSPYGHLIQNSDTLLRFVTLVEIMAPIFEMDFFQGFIRPSLFDAFSGWALDYIWPFLLHYPRDRIAVIDDVCMLHTTAPMQKQGEGSIYAALSRVVKYDAGEEMLRRNAQYNYFPSEVKALGFSYTGIEVVGLVPRPVDLEPTPVAATISAAQTTGLQASSLLLWGHVALVSGLLALLLFRRAKPWLPGSLWRPLPLPGFILRLPRPTLPPSLPA